MACIVPNATATNEYKNFAKTTNGASPKCHMATDDAAMNASGALVATKPYVGSQTFLRCQLQFDL